MSNNTTFVLVITIVCLFIYGIIREATKESLIQSEIEYRYVMGGYVQDPKTGKWGKR